MTVAERALGLAGSRSDRVRSRRVRDGASALTVGRTYEPAEPLRPPRGPRRSPRRRYDLVLPLEARSVVRLPSVPVVHFGPRLLSAVMVVACVLAISRVLSSPAFAVGQVEVSGARMLSANQLRSVARADLRPVFLVDPAAVAARLLLLPEIAAAHVRIRWPNRVVVEVEERHPLVAWNDGGRTWWISPEGFAFLEHGDWPGLVKVEASRPVLKIGNDPLQPVIEPELLWAAAALSAQVPEIDVLQFQPEHGLGFHDPAGWNAYFGRGGDMVIKMQLYRTLAAHLATRNFRPTFVSVEDPSAPYYSTEKETR